MSSHRLLESSRDLGWSVFAELGVPGVVRHHQHVVIDPEPIVVAAPALMALDPRLRDQVYGWCAAHSSRLSVSRMQGLLRQLDAREQAAFGSFTRTLREHAKVRWPVVDGPEPWPTAPEVSPPRLPLERPALLRLRIRALSGVGARADVLCELLARHPTWTRSSDLAREGYSKRSIALILADLADAGLAKSRAIGNAMVYQLARPELLSQIVGQEQVGHPPWRLVMRLVLDSIRLTELEARPAAVRRVEANKLRDGFADLADQLDLAQPPPTRGNREAWEGLTAWATEQVQQMASGASPR